MRPMDEPTTAEAAALVDALMGAGTVGRLDLVHQALRNAYLRGRADVRVESQEICTRAAQRFADAAQRLAQTHAEEFVAAVTERASVEAERAALPWSERLRAV
jgi:hypothetical protein